MRPEIQILNNPVANQQTATFRSITVQQRGILSDCIALFPQVAPFFLNSLIGGGGWNPNWVHLALRPLIGLL
jgi:hypothetical protein